MKAVIQRVSEAQVSTEGQPSRGIGRGLMVLIGIEPEDGPEQIDWMVRRICQLRLFNDADGRMNSSLLDISGDLLLVSQFTLLAECDRGRRPSFSRAAPPEIANPLFEQSVEAARRLCNGTVECGWFGAEMKVHLTNDGPLTITLHRS